ncbi:hypothetical protein JQ597_22020 [Bradyrhizobium sp. AUGA SZCCT0177]|uniref:hypothetical protein n=2 Tax=unclassified Bradyrhizobium TaxID=2631580 RepID=UPI001BAB9D63|nr:hypothetical protein [Bradyrhizobium sp. AUGA SZCCT0177]MBR1284728.1 hypothetical protein [Bradyrhizobium sp. AUGA SZCCT0177]
MIVATWQLVSRPSLSTRERGNRSKILIAALRRRLPTHKPDETQKPDQIQDRRKTVLRLVGRLHVEPLGLSGRNHRRCRSHGQGHDCKGKSDESQASPVRHRSGPYPNAYRSDVATPAAMRVAMAASVQSGRALCVASPLRVFAKLAIMPSPTLGSEAIQIRKSGACQFFGIAFTSLPFSAQVPLKRATTRIGRVNIIVRGQVHGPGSINGSLQRKLVIHFELPIFRACFQFDRAKKVAAFSRKYDSSRRAG